VSARTATAWARTVLAAATSRKVVRLFLDGDTLTATDHGHWPIARPMTGATVADVEAARAALIAGGVARVRASRRAS